MPQGIIARFDIIRNKMMNAEEFPVVLFSSQDGDVRVNAVLRDRTLWLTQKSMAGLFGVKSQAITKHLKNIYATGELQIAATCSKMEQVQSEGGRRVAREIVYSRADAAREHMGLKTWKNAPDGRVLKSDVIIAKNYLSAEQVKELEGAVVGYFDYIERIIKRHQTFTMEEFARSVNAFLEFNEYETLEGMGSVSRAKADEKAYAEYDEFSRHQQIESDFDRQIKLLLDGGNA